MAAMLRDSTVVVAVAVAVAVAVVVVVVVVRTPPPAILLAMKTIRKPVHRFPSALLSIYGMCMGKTK